ncbi:MAG: GNAT family N-acetyltransferase [Clostridia bacterium]|nr:GNAT family N-acetyltransferase [Clostridia bacterium]
MQILRPDFSSRDELAALWARCFPEDTPTQAQAYFKGFFNEGLAWCVKDKNRIIAMLQTVPYRLSIRGKPREAKTFTGVCVHPEYRGRGVAGSLMRHAIAEAKEEGLPLFFLHTGSPEVYSGVGFADIVEVKRFLTSETKKPRTGESCRFRIAYETSPDSKILQEMSAVYAEWTKPYNMHTLRDSAAFARLAAMEEIYSAKWFTARNAEGQLAAYALVEYEINEILELVWSDTKAAKSLLEHLPGLLCTMPVDLGFAMATTPPPHKMARAVHLPALCEGLPAEADGEIILQITDPVFDSETWRFSAKGGRLSVLRLYKTALDRTGSEHVEITVATLTQWLTGYPTALPKNLEQKMLAMLPPKQNVMFEIM